MDQELDSLLDELFFEETLAQDLLGISRIDFIYSSIAFNSNTYYAGRSIGIDEFNVVPQLTYLSSSGWSMNLSGVYLNGVQPAWDVTALSLGYAKSLEKGLKNFGLYANYSRYFFSFESDTLFSNGITLGTTYQSEDNKFYASSSGNLFFGGNTLFQFVSSFSYSLNLSKKTLIEPSKKKEKMWVSSVGDIKRKPFQFIRQFNLSFEPKITFLINQETLGLFNSSNLSFSQQPLFSSETVFSLTNTQLKFPLIFESGNLDIEAAYYLNLPRAIGNESDLNTTGFFGLSVGYFFSL